MIGPGTDQYLFEFDDEENEVEDENIDEDGRDEEDVAWDNEHAPGSNHRDY